MSQQDVFETGADRIDVTSLHRPDVGRTIVDAQGHEHRWHVTATGLPGTGYDASVGYDMPSLVWVKDGEAYWPGDEEPHDVGHHECRICGEHIEPRYTADTTQQYVAGLRWYRINGEHVSPEEFDRRVREAKS